MELDFNKKISELSVREYLSLQKIEKKYAYGIVGIAKIFGCSVSKAYEIKRTGIIDGAIFQREKIIVTDIEKALYLFGSKDIE